MKPVTILAQLTELLYPRRCPVCDEILERNVRYVCSDCAKKLEFLTGAICLRCGKPLEDDQEEYCFDCKRRKHSFHICRAPFVYRGVMKESLMRFKYLGRAEYAGFYARAMVEFGRLHSIFDQADLLIPVPVHRTRQIERGYNQAAVLGKEIEELVGIPLVEDCVIRRKKTAAQKSVSGARRSRNLSDAFQVPPKKKKILTGKKILLIDDIYTTGSTADAVAEKLLQAGAVSVSVLCVSVSPGFS